MLTENTADINNSIHTDKTTLQEENDFVTTVNDVEYTDDYSLSTDIKRAYKKPTTLKFSDVVTVQCILCLAILLCLVISNILWPDAIDEIAEIYKDESQKIFPLPQQLLDFIKSIMPQHV